MTTITPPDALARRLFREALEVVRSSPLDDLAIAPWAGGPPAPVAGLARGQQIIPAGRPDDLWSLSERLRRGDITVAEAVAASREQIARFDAQFGAFDYVVDTDALTASRTAEAAAGRWRGPLHGVPISIKDVIHVAGMPTGASSAAYPRAVVDDEGRAVQRLRQSGAIVVGKAATHEFALGVTTPQARNPWDPARIPGGSSGGSAISIVTGMAMASLGTDTRASIRVPAALSGAVGFKPSFGRVPCDGLVTLSWSMDHIAPMGRSVRDVALLMDVLIDTAHHRAALPGELAGRQLRWSDAFLAGADPAIVRLFREVLAAAEAAGATVIEADTPAAGDLALANAAGMIVSRCEAATYHREIGTDLGRCTPETAGQLREALEVGAEDYLRAQRLRAMLRGRLLAALGDADAFVMPTSKVVAPRAEDASRYLLVLSENCIPWSFVDLPAISLPLGMVGRLPVGLQIVGRPGEDADTLALAHAWEGLLPALPAWSPALAALPADETDGG